MKQCTTVFRKNPIETSSSCNKLILNNIDTNIFHGNKILYENALYNKKGLLINPCDEIGPLIKYLQFEGLTDSFYNYLNIVMNSVSNKQMIKFIRCLYHGIENKHYRYVLKELLSNNDVDMDVLFLEKVSPDELMNIAISVSSLRIYSECLNENTGMSEHTIYCNSGPKKWSDNGHYMAAMYMPGLVYNFCRYKYIPFFNDKMISNKNKKELFNLNKEKETNEFWSKAIKQFEDSNEETEEIKETEELLNDIDLGPKDPKDHKKSKRSKKLKKQKKQKNLKTKIIEDKYYEFNEYEIISKNDLEQIKILKDSINYYLSNIYRFITDLKSLKNIEMLENPDSKIKEMMLEENQEITISCQIVIQCLILLFKYDLSLYSYLYEYICYICYILYFQLFKLDPDDINANPEKTNVIIKIVFALNKNNVSIRINENISILLINFIVKINLKLPYLKNTTKDKVYIIPTLIKVFNMRGVEEKDIIVNYDKKFLLNILHNDGII